MCAETSTGMAADGGNSRLGRLVRRSRHELGLSRSQLAKRCEVSASTLASVEQGRQAPSIAVCLRLARALRVPPRQVIDARVLDELRDQPSARRALENELASGVWNQSAQHRLRIVQGDVRLDVEDDGTLQIERSYRGCTTARARREIVFRDRIVGHQPSQIDIQRTPVEYELRSRTVGPWCEHRVAFREPWTRGSLDVVVRVTLPHAYLPGDLDEINRRQKAAGLPQQSEPRGIYQYYLQFAFEYLTLSMRFPESFGVRWAAPAAAPDRAPFEDGDLLTLDDISLESEWTEGSHCGRLRLKRPLPSSSVFLTWYSKP